MIPEISNNAFGWKIKANIPASMEEAKSTTIEGVFLAIMIPVTIGTIISQGVIWNEPFKASEKAAIWDASAASPRESGDAEYDQCDDHRGNGRIKHIPDMREKGACPLRRPPIPSCSDKGDILSPK